jgi:hypothetical protein
MKLIGSSRGTGSELKDLVKAKELNVEMIQA